MNKKLVLAAALIFGFAGLMLSNTVKAQEANAMDNSAMVAENAVMNAENAENAVVDNAAAAEAAPAAVENAAK